MILKEDLDPRTSLGITFNFILFGFIINKPLPSHVLFFISNLYLLSARAYKKCLLYICIYIITIILMFYIHNIPNSSFLLIIVSVNFIFQKFIIAMMMMTFLNQTTSMPYVISAMQTLKFPNILAIPLIVMFRYMPTLKEDYISLKDSLKIRGVSISPFHFFLHPIKILEFLIVPILFRSLNIAEELSKSVLLRGIENYRYRTNIYPCKFKKKDIIYIFFTTVVINVLIYLQFF